MEGFSRTPHFRWGVFRIFKLAFIHPSEHLNAPPQEPPVRRTNKYPECCEVHFVWSDTLHEVSNNHSKRRRWGCRVLTASIHLPLPLPRALRERGPLNTPQQQVALSNRSPVSPAPSARHPRGSHQRTRHIISKSK